MQRPGDGSSVVTDAVIGAVAGAAAVWVMDRVDWFNFLHVVPSEARRRTQAVRPGGMDPAHVAADKIATAAGYDLEPKGNNPVGQAVHYSVGIAPAVLYSVLRRRTPAVTAGHGSLFGLGFFLVEDEGLNTLTGLSAPQGAYPWQAHARGLAAHLAYGVATELALNAAEKALGRRAEG